MTTFTTQDRQDAQRTPLTAEQIQAIYQSAEILDYITVHDTYEFARAIERAHGIGE